MQQDHLAIDIVCVN